MARTRKPALTRRAFAAVLAAPALAQPPANPPTDEAASARAAVADNGAQLSRVAVPIAVEPAFQFKV